MAESPNYQFDTGVEYKLGDRGTGAWAVGPGPDEVPGIPEIPAVPGSVVLSEDFEGSLWTEITEISGTWVTTTAHSHSATTSYTNPDIGDGQSASFTIQNDAFDAQVSFWLRTDTESGFDKFRVFIDSVEVYSESGFNDWHRVAIPTGFGFIIEFRYTKDGSVSSGDDACWVDDIVQGSLDIPAIPAVPAIPARPFVYTPLKMTDDGERLKVEDLAAETSLDVIEAIETGTNVKFASFQSLVAGDLIIVPLVLGKRIRVLSYAMTTDSTGNQRWKSGLLTNISGLLRLDRNGNGIVYAGTPSAPAFQTAVGASLVLNATANTGGHVTYIEV